MINLILIGVIILIIGLAIRYIVKAKKSGVKCIGCPSSGKCSSNQSCPSCAEENTTSSKL